MVILDTHRTVKRLQEAGFTTTQAETVTEVLREAQTIDLSHLATKADLAPFVTKADLAEFKADLFKWLIPLLLGQSALIAALVKLL